MNGIEMIVLCQNIEENQNKYSRLLKRSLRDFQDPFDISDSDFIKLYRFPKHLVLNLVDELNVHIYESRYNNGIPVHQKILSALRFYATGSYQRSVGQEALISLSQTCMSNNIFEVSLAINKLLGKYIKFPKTNDDRLKVKQK